MPPKLKKPPAELLPVNTTYSGFSTELDLADSPFSPSEDRSSDFFSASIRVEIAPRRKKDSDSSSITKCNPALFPPESPSQPSAPTDSRRSRSTCLCGPRRRPKLVVVGIQRSGQATALAQRYPGRTDPVSGKKPACSCSVNSAVLNNLRLMRTDRRSRLATGPTSRNCGGLITGDSALSNCIKLMLNGGRKQGTGQGRNRSKPHTLCQPRVYSRVSRVAAFRRQKMNGIADTAKELFPMPTKAERTLSRAFFRQQSISLHERSRTRSDCYGPCF